MVLVNYSAKEINAKVVYYGPGLCGKTTNLEFIYGRVPQTNRGKMVSMKTRTERTLFFDFLPLNLGDLAGFQTRFLLYTVPGQIYYNATRKLVLKGVDALVFVADSGRGMMEENLESFQNLRDNLREHGLNLEDVPLVLQYNKRDLPDVYTLDELQHALNPTGSIPYYEAVATNGQGVFETFKGVARLLLAHLAKKMGIQQAASEVDDVPVAPAAPAAPAAPRAPSQPASAPASTSAPPSGSFPSLSGVLEAPRSPAPRAESGPRVVPGQRPQPVIERAEPVPFSSSTAPPEAPAPKPAAAPGVRLQQGAAALLSGGATPSAVPEPSPVILDRGSDSMILESPRPASKARATTSTADKRVISIPIVLEPSDVENGFVLELRVDVSTSSEPLRRVG